MPVTAGEARAYLARFLFRGDDAFKEIRMLSGGERSRLELALLGIQPSNLLLLDEPTNHLDIPAREAIEAFMAESPATLLVVSHDRRLLETVCEKLWVVGEGSAVAFDGGYREWRRAVADGWTVEEALRQTAPRPSVRLRPLDATPVSTIEPTANPSPTTHNSSQTVSSNRTPPAGFSCAPVAPHEHFNSMPLGAGISRWFVRGSEQPPVRRLDSGATRAAIARRPTASRRPP